MHLFKFRVVLVTPFGKFVEHFVEQDTFKNASGVIKSIYGRQGCKVVLCHIA